MWHSTMCPAVAILMSRKSDEDGSSCIQHELPINIYTSFDQMTRHDSAHGYSISDSYSYIYLQFIDQNRLFAEPRSICQACR